MLHLDIVAGEVAGNIYITVYKTTDGNILFSLQIDNDNVLPVLDVIEDTLVMY